MSGRRKLLIALAVVAAPLLLIVLPLVVLGSFFGEDTVVSGPEVSSLTGDVPESFVHFEDTGGVFAIDLHPDWIGLSLRGDVNGLGTSTAPDDPDRAAAIDAAVASAPRELVFIALDGEVLGQNRFVPNINVDPVPRRGASIEEIEASIPREVEAFGAGEARVERVSTSQGDGLRMTYRFDRSGPLSGVEGRQYYLLAGDTVWVLTLTSDDMTTDQEHFDASASSFTLR